MVAIAVSSDLGTLSILPRELRNRIYEYLLDSQLQAFEAEDDDCSCTSGICNHEYISPMNILWTSKRIHHEAKLVYFQINEFHIGIERDYRRPRENCSISGLPGYNIMVGDTARAKSYWQEVPYDMIPCMRKIHLCVGGNEGVCEADLVPPKIRDVHGPERPTYIPVQSLMEEMCKLLDSSDALQFFGLSIKSGDKIPGSIENLLVPIRRLRGIPRTNIVCWSMQADMWTDWNLKGSYARYLNRLLALPRGAPPMKYVGDEKEPDQSEDSIFDVIGGYWNGGQGFIYSREDDTGSEDDGHLPFVDYNDYIPGLHGVHPTGWDDVVEWDIEDDDLGDLQDDEASIN